MVPDWATDYERSWLKPDLVAGVVIWSIVVPQAVAYAQIAGLPPGAGLMAAPGALLAYAFLGTSRSLVVSATTATSAVSAAAVAPLVGGDPGEFAALSAMFALVCAVVLFLAGALKLGAISDLVSKPVMTGFLFGLGLTIMIAQLPSVIGVEPGDGNFFPRVYDLIGDLDQVDLDTVLVGAGCLVVLLAGRILRPAFPATLLVLAGAILASSLLDLSSHGVAVVGEIPSALPDPSVPDVGLGDALNLVGAALGVLLVSAEAVGVARSIATEHGYSIKPNRDLIALGGSNLLAGLSGGFVQSGGASQTAAADRAGGRTQLATVVCAALTLLTGAFLAPLFENLPQATLGAIVVVAIGSFFRVDELRRFARIRRSAIAFASIALIGVLVLGVLQGLIVAAGLSLVYLIKRISRPAVTRLARNPATGNWGSMERHPDWEATGPILAVRSESFLLYPNVVNVKERVLAMTDAEQPPPSFVVVDLSLNYELDVETLDALADLDAQLRQRSISLRLAGVRAPARTLIERGGLDRRIDIHTTLDGATGR